MNAFGRADRLRGRVKWPYLLNQPANDRYDLLHAFWLIAKAIYLFLSFFSSLYETSDRSKIEITLQPMNEYLCVFFVHNFRPFVGTWMQRNKKKLPVISDYERIGQWTRAVLLCLLVLMTIALDVHGEKSGRKTTDHWFNGQLALLDGFYINHLGFVFFFSSRLSFFFLMRSQSF